MGCASRRGSWVRRKHGGQPAFNFPGRNAGQMVIPDDVIYKVIFPFLVNRDGCGGSDSQILLVNKRAYSAKPVCFSSPKIHFGNQVWCSVHTPQEYNFSMDVKSRANLSRIVKMVEDLLVTNKTNVPFFILNFTNSNDEFTYHDVDRVYTPNELLYYWGKILENSSYQIEHLCCGGNGVVFSRRVKVIKNFLES